MEDANTSDEEEFHESEWQEPELDDGEAEEEVAEVQHALVPLKQNDRSLVPLDPLAAYLREIRQYEEMTEEEEHEMAVQYTKDGDMSAAYRLITSNLVLVVRIAMTFRREWQNMMDLIQEGNVGLMKAVKNFDPMRGVRLPAYATWWIRSYILKFLLDNWRMVKVGTTNTRRKLLYNLKKEKEKLEQQGFEPSTKLLAERFGVDESEVIDVAAGLGASDLSVDTPYNAGSTLTPLDTLSDGHSLEDQYVNEHLFDAFNDLISEMKDSLKPIEVQIIEERLLSSDPKSLREIGEENNVTREAIRQAEQRLKNKIKAFISERLPEAADYFKESD
ncbi:MAG: sigma-70 family RNA polymerase sigma factor [Candidatus Nitrohelix vancouverensis]|uniref:RNA polymerase sigma factor n=1 Tax=Candidatus Nitrohelix vancouverensis TaxID=2705534 RepID=A0A7T0C0X5_9BACT|nr:MAG: sigma-70 family RNA polymerase sigma factor [Candidatus Nitrohelix vancouverensis]